MKYLILLFIILNFSKSVWSQTNSENGFWQPCRGQLRVLLIYAEMVNDPNYNIVTQTGWPEGQMPTNPGKYFDINYSNNLTGYITKYFNEASFGEYQVLGDYYPQLIQIDYNNSTSANFFSKVINALHQTIGTDLTTANNLSINNQDFDKWSNYNLGVQKLEIPDYKIDMIIVLWRVNSYITGIQNPTSNQGSINLTQLNISLKNSVGLNCRSNFVSFDNNADVIMRHELSHALYGYNNFHTAGAGAGTRTFMSSVGGWSNMSSWDSNSQGWNAWDRWRLGWKNPSKQYLISSYNSQNNAETDFENYSLSNNPNGGEYVLRDFNSTGDAIRIKLPTVDNNALPQYLWLENHSLSLSEFDFNENRNNATDNLKAKACFPTILLTFYKNKPRVL